MRVLIAEDDPVIALALVERVRSLGHEPLGPVGDGAQAVAEATASRPDLYLFDIEMPELDGLSAAAELAARGLGRPVVVITGVDDRGLIERSVATGAGAYLTKPIDTRELEAAIRSRRLVTRSSRRCRPRWRRRSRRSRSEKSSSARRAC